MHQTRTPPDSTHINSIEWHNWILSFFLKINIYMWEVYGSVLYKQNYVESATSTPPPTSFQKGKGVISNRLTSEIKVIFFN